MKSSKLLSVNGSTRATDYTLSNKIVTHQGFNFERLTRHHVVDIPWLIFRTGHSGKDCIGAGVLNKVTAIRFDRGGRR